MVCKVCSKFSEEVFKTLVLQKYEVKYFKCTNCQFIQTEEPFWLQEAYESAITNLDIGLVGRNIHYSGLIKQIVSKWFDSDAKFLDYGGGYGMFVRLMRDLGIDFYRYDIYCENLFSKYFDYSDLPEGSKFEALTAFEVFEHLSNPMEEVEKMFTLSDSIIFSTELQPNGKVTPENWWYFVPETGQHIALYSRESLQFIADNFGANLSSKGNLHLLTNKKGVDLSQLEDLTFKSRLKKKLISFLTEKERKTSLLQTDFNLIKEKIVK